MGVVSGELSWIECIHTYNNADVHIFFIHSAANDFLTAHPSNNHAFLLSVQQSICTENTFASSEKTQI